VKSVFGFRVRLGNPDLDFENLNPDFPIKCTHSCKRMIAGEIGRLQVRNAVSGGMCISVLLLFDNEFELRADKQVVRGV